MDKRKQEFLDQEYLSNSVTAAIVRGKDNPTYIPNATTEQRTKLGRTLRRELRSLQTQYQTAGVTDSEHVGNIKKLAKKVTEDCQGFLKDGRFRFGRAQKALNLYLKYLWCAGRVALPPHCPFDSIVIGKLPRPLADVAWTKLDNEESYLELVRAARGLAGAEPLSEWELRVYAESQDKSEEVLPEAQ